MLVKCLIILLIGIIFLPFHSLKAKNLKASLAILPIHSEKGINGIPKGGFVEVVKAIDEVYKEGRISVNLYPFPRSLGNITEGRADFHIPLIKVPNVNKNSLPFTYASECITKVTFVLYTRGDRQALDRKVVAKMKNARIDTLRGHKDLFDFKISEVDTIGSGIEKMVRGRSDGFIMEQDAVDHYIRKEKISNVRRALFAVWDSCIVIAKGEEGKKVDTIISMAIRKLRANGRLEQINKTIHQPYDDWQPYLNN